MNLDFSDIKILLVGDFMVDHYILGTSNRMSPEAPVPVVNHQNSYSIPGGAGNVAMNINAMGGNVTCLGVVGDDIWGKKLLNILKNKGINIDDINIVKDYPTTLKQRIYSNGKQVARIDTEEIIDYNLDDLIENNNCIYDAVILSDYNKGVLNNSLSALTHLNNVIVDPKKDNFHHYIGAKIITPNLKELKRASKIDIIDDKSLVLACKDLIKKYDFTYIVAKKGSAGITIVGKDGYVENIMSNKAEKPDVTGAGDTVIAALSLAYAKTRDISLSAKIANTAAGIVVTKTGTATVSMNEIEI